MKCDQYWFPFMLPYFFFYYFLGCYKAPLKSVVLCILAIKCIITDISDEIIINHFGLGIN